MLSPFLHHFDNLAHLLRDLLIALPFMGAEAAGAVLDAVFGIGEIAAAVFAQGIEGAVAENAGESLGICVFVAGEIFTLLVLEKIIVGHDITSFELDPGELVGGWSGEGQFFVGLGVTEAQKA